VETAVEPVKTRKRAGRPRKGTEKLTYEKVKGLVRKGIVSPAAIAEITGSSTSSASSALERYGFTKSGIDEFRKIRSDILAGKQEILLNAITEEKAKSSSLRDVGIVLGILSDKESQLAAVSVSGPGLARFVVEVDASFVAALRGIPVPTRTPGTPEGPAIDITPEGHQ